MHHYRNIETYRNVDSRKRPILPLHSSPKNSPGSQAALQEETYSNPLKKKARVSLYNKTSPNNPRPPSTSPFRSNTPLGSGTPQSGAVLSSSSVVDLDKLGVNELLPPPHKGATNWSPKSSERKPKQRTDISTPKYLPKEPSDTVTPLESSSTVRTKSNLPRQKQQPVDRHQRVPPSQVFPHSDDVRSDDATIPSPGTNGSHFSITVLLCLHKYLFLVFISLGLLSKNISFSNPHPVATNEYPA